MKILFSCLLSAILMEAGTCKRAANCIDESRIDTAGVCTMQYLPVCGCDGITYSNQCMAEKSGVTAYKDGACEESGK